MSENPEASPPEGAPKEETSIDPAAEWKSKVLYLTAEIENMRKRFAREKGEVIRMANEDLVRMVLPVLDNLSFAVKAAREAEQKVEKEMRENPVFANLLKGIEMTLKHFEQTLEQAGVQAVKALGTKFDPTQHEAVGQTQDPQHQDEQISAEVQKGFAMFGRVIRPAKVLVNKIGEEAKSEEDAKKEEK